MTAGAQLSTNPRGSHPGITSTTRDPGVPPMESCSILTS
jgi:hypothetical protein